MPSQGSQSFSQSSPLCLPLAKFSYATVSGEGVAPIPWLHIGNKKALFAIFETSPVQLEDGRIEQRQKFKVLQDPEVMEELDLNALSVEAHRSLMEKPKGSMSIDPEVNIVVQVPLIAIKYPLPSGQIRRFQIRFSRNEDYYEAMKMLSRADVPTVEAGTFPTRKPPPAPRSVARSLVAPSDSASQMGRSIPRQREHPTNDDALSLFRPVPTVMSAMPPPQMFPVPAQGGKYSLSVRPPPDGDLRTAQAPDLQPAYPKSNISLSTATTLVPGGQRLTFRAVQDQSEPEGLGDIRNGQSTRASPPRPGFETSRRDIGLGLRGGQLAPTVTRSEVNSHSHSQLGRGNGDVGSGKGQSDRHLTGLEVDSVLTGTTTKGKGKRAATNKTTKTPVAKKPRPAASRKTSTTKQAEDKRVPTVDELLQQPGYSLLPNTTTVGAPCNPRVEDYTTELVQTRNLEIAETDYEADQLQTQGSPFLGSTTNRHMTRSVSRALSSIPLQHARESGGRVHQATLPPCTPADQIMSSPATPASPVTQTHTSAPPQPTSLSETSSNTRVPQSSGAPPVTDSALLAVAQQCLSTDPAFDLSSAKSRLDAWLKLPEPARALALRAYFCDLVMTEGFSQLCKSVDMFWEGAVLEGKMMMMTAARAANEGVEEED
ncbi:hypothetical protein AYL99_04254 [Fonsecaea erecta]|uniref:Uncharacterized protein n=1 Tax=Fonsecaea erecta TaxID=1367422 RepID=A0A178ZRG6_9EURO|nr:hypothetical protein AYL99_04254 [Fonsecaea erecta]OAP62051.1 hypothetical protein AYL99_04254 [Fonsecaea erecta]